MSLEAGFRPAMISCCWRLRITARRLTLWTRRWRVSDLNQCNLHAGDIFERPSRTERQTGTVADGQDGKDETLTQVVLVQDWFEELTRPVPAP